MNVLTDVGGPYPVPIQHGTNAGPGPNAGQFVDLLKLAFFGRHTTNTMLVVEEPAPVVPRAVDPLAAIKSVAYQLDAIKRIADLTDEEVARLLGTSRQTLYNWRQGRKISARREQRLEKSLNAIRSLGGGNPQATRRLLMASEKGQIRVYDLLAEGSIEEAEAVAGGRPLPISRLPKEYPLATQMDLLEDRAPTPRPTINKRFSKRL